MYRRPCAFFALFSVFLGLFGQNDTLKLTLQIDMSLVVPNDFISVAGSFQDEVLGQNWTDWTPGEVMLFDADNDLTFDVSFDILAGSYELKFLNGPDWGFEESIPCACAINANREMHLSGTADTTIRFCFAHCAAQCNPEPDTSLIPVTFRVDMSQTTVHPGGLYVAGDFQMPSWDLDSLQMEDPDQDNVYTYTHHLRPGEYQFKFFNGDSGEPDAEAYPFKDQLGCGCDNGLGGSNRLLVVPEGLDSLKTFTHVYNSCDLTTNIDHQLAEKRVAIFPNPMEENLFVEFQSVYHPYSEVSIIDLRGKRLRSYSIAGISALQIERGNLLSGLYVIKIIRLDGYSFTKKLILL